MAVLIRCAGPVAQYIVTKKLEVYFSLPGRSRETRPARLVHHRDDPTSTTNGLVSGDFLHLESSKRSRNVVFSDAVRGGGSIVEHILRQLRRLILRYVAIVLGVGTGLAALHRNAPASIRAGHVGG